MWNAGDNLQNRGVLQTYPARHSTPLPPSPGGGIGYGTNLKQLYKLAFATQKVLENMPTGEQLYPFLSILQEKGVKGVADEFGTLQAVAEKDARYQCRCSKEYLGEVLVSLGEGQMREIIQEDGAVRIHCHYCNKDYEFFEEDVDLLFGSNERMSSDGTYHIF